MTADITAEENLEGEKDLVKGSALYREFLAEREEILRHKWLKSEKEGRDIGFEHALLDWMFHHRSKWHQERREAEPAS